MGKHDPPEPKSLKSSLDRVARSLGGPDAGSLSGVFEMYRPGPNVSPPSRLTAHDALNPFCAQ